MFVSLYRQTWREQRRGATLEGSDSRGTDNKCFFVNRESQGSSTTSWLSLVFPTLFFIYLTNTYYHAKESVVSRLVRGLLRRPAT